MLLKWHTCLIGVPLLKTKQNINANLSIRVKILSKEFIEALLHERAKSYYYNREYSPPKTEEELETEIREFVKALMDIEGYSLQQVVVKYKTRMIDSFGTARVYSYLFNTKLTRFINIGKDYRKADALITTIIKYDKHNYNSSYDFVIDGLYEQFNDTYKVYIQTYMYDQKYITKKEYISNMVELCGTPILNSKLVSRSYIGVGGTGRYLNEYVYQIFYSNFTGVSNYKLWVGEHMLKPVSRPNKVYDSFTVTLDIKEKIPYLIEVINSGINYSVRFNKKFVSKDNIELLMDSLAGGCKKSKINTSLKQKIGNSTEQFNKSEMADLDQFVLKMRSINKSYANKIARANPKGCVGYNTYKKL